MLLSHNSKQYPIHNLCKTGWKTMENPWMSPAFTTLPPLPVSVLRSHGSHRDTGVQHVFSQDLAATTASQWYLVPGTHGESEKWTCSHEARWLLWSDVNAFPLSPLCAGIIKGVARIACRYT